MNVGNLLQDLSFQEIHQPKIKNSEIKTFFSFNADFLYAFLLLDEQNPFEKAMDSYVGPCEETNVLERN